MKKAIFTGPNQPLKVVTGSIPNVPVGGALIKTLYSGVCHSDVHLREDTIHLGGGEALNFLKIFGECHSYHLQYRVISIHTILIIYCIMANVRIYRLLPPC